MGKTKAIFINYAEQKKIKVNSKDIGIVKEYNYLGKVARTEEWINFELNRRLLSRWKAFRKHAEILKGNLPLSL